MVWKFHPRLSVWMALVLLIWCGSSDVVEGQSWLNKPAQPPRSTRTTPGTTTTTTKPTTTTTTAKPTTTTSTPPPPVARKSGFIFPTDDDMHIDETRTPSNKMPLEIPLSLLQQLNEAEDLSQFLQYVENVTVIRGEEEGDQPILVGSWETIDGRVGSAAERDSSVAAKAANCVPELQTVPIAASDDPSVLYYPTCTRIERCGGCCSSELLACEPVRQETVLLQVIKTQYAGGSKVKFAGKEVIPVQKHTQCKCQCKTKESDCGRNQAYVPGACKCECTNIDDRRKCETENQTRFWDSRECACRCRDSAQQCSTGFYFNEDVCRCDPWLSRRSESTGFRAVLGERGRQPGSADHHKEGDEEVVDRISGPKWSIDKDFEEEEDKASRPLHRVHLNRNWNTPN